MVVRIAKDKATAMAEEAADTASVKIYSDGSGFKGGIGASAVMYREGGRDGRTQRSLTAYLGTEDEQTVYVGELAGELMDLHLLATENPGPTGLGRVSIYVDNQASLLALDSIKPKSGGFIADEIHRTFERVRKKHPRSRITFRWIPSHLEVGGNEEADRLAKQGAERKELSEVADLPPLLRKKLPLSKSALDMALMKDLKRESVGNTRLEAVGSDAGYRPLHAINSFPKIHRREEHDQRPGVALHATPDRPRTAQRAPAPPQSHQQPGMRSVRKRI